MPRYGIQAGWSLRIKSEDMLRLKALYGSREKPSAAISLAA